ncbi:MAG: hypothetical protein QM771_02895 [Nitrospira sp.]
MERLWERLRQAPHWGQPVSQQEQELRPRYLEPAKQAHQPQELPPVWEEPRVLEGQAVLA